MEKQTNSEDSQMEKKLYRSRKNRLLAGICGGLGDYFGVDPTVVRLIMVVAAIFSFGAGLLFYLIAWLIVPEAPAEGSL
jgi:phage shock protein PspC (stress-responsive transcriptional regulator)